MANTRGARIAGSPSSSGTPRWVLWLAVASLLAILALDGYFLRASCDTDVNDSLFRFWLGGTPVLLLLCLVLGATTSSIRRPWLTLGVLVVLSVTVAVLHPIVWFKFFGCSE
jgi:hypothetical protein